MLPRAEPPARQLPYTTADMAERLAERLAKRKAEQDAATNAQLAGSVLGPGITRDTQGNIYANGQKVDWSKPVAPTAVPSFNKGTVRPPAVEEDKGGGTGLWPSWGELGNAAKMGLDTFVGAVNSVPATALDTADEIVQGLEKAMGVDSEDHFDPAFVGSYNLFGETYRGIDNAAQYIIKQIAATPGVGKPSSSPFMDTVRSQGWANAIAEPFVHAVNVGSVAYPVSKVAVGAKLPGTITNAYRQRLLDREYAARYPAVVPPKPGTFIEMVQDADGVWRPTGATKSPATPATRLAEAQTQRALPPSVQRVLPPATTSALLPSVQRALPLATTADMAERLARAQARQQTHFGTVSKEPIEQLQSKEFDRLSPINPYDGGVPDPMFEAKDAYSLPVYEIGGEKIAFGNPTLGRFDPEFNTQNVKIIPANPYDITGLPKTSVEGRQFGELYFDAMNGFTIENASKFRDGNLGQVPALIYAASRGDNIAMQELQRLATVAKTKMAADKIEYINKELKNIQTDWSQSPDVMVQTTNALGYRTEHPLGVDDIVMTHQTNFAPEIDPVTGQRFIRPTQDHTPIDPETGKPYIDPVTGKPKPSPDQINIHMAANHVVMGHMSRNMPTSGGYIVTGPLRDLLDANPGSLNNLQSVDSWFTPPPGEGLILPDSWRIIKTPGLDKYNYKTPTGNPNLDWTRRQQEIHTYMLDKLEKEIDDLVLANMSEIAKLHNKSNDYQFNEIAKGVHGSSTDINDRFKQIAGEIIPQEYPEYVGGVTSMKHTGTPSHDNQTISFYDPVNIRRSGMFVMYPWMLSPNAKLRYFDSNKFTTGEIITISETPSFG